MPNYRLSSSPTPSGKWTKYAHNIAAINLLKSLGDPPRPATPEEQTVLAGYVGWGQFPELFGEVASGDTQLESRRAELRELLTPDEYDAARASTVNAHYTSPQVIDKMYALLARLGFDGGNVLEPATGSGNFIGRVPDALANSTHFTGIELDPTSAKLSAALYPDAQIHNQPFEKFSAPDAFYDATLTNVPFGDFKLHEPRYNRLNLRIHDHFIAKSLDKTRPGGLACIVTSSGTMQSSKSRTLREHASRTADFLGAIRLPSDAFKGNAGTEVTTDILVFRKRLPGERPAGQPWLDTVPSGVVSDASGEELLINEYFAANPHMMLGAITDDKLYPGRAALTNTAPSPEAFDAAFDRAMAAFPENVFTKSQAAPQALHETIPAPDHVKPGAWTILEDGRLAVRNAANTLEPTDLPAKSAERVRAMIGLRTATRALLQAQITPNLSEEIVEAARAALNTEYDKFTKSFGFLCDSANKRLFRGDPDGPLLLALEKDYKLTKVPNGKTTSTAEKADIFRIRTVTPYSPPDHADTPGDALAICLNERGRVDLDFMAGLLNAANPTNPTYTPEHLQQALAGRIFFNPEGRAWETSDQYLSGNVRAKLETATQAAALDPIYAQNVKALNEVQPKDLTPSEIDARLGSPWIPTTDIVSFANHIFERPADSQDLTIAHSPLTASWAIGVEAWHIKSSVQNTEKWGTSRYTATEALEDALNGRTPTIYDYDSSTDSRVQNVPETMAAREKLENLKNEFKTWIFADFERANRLATKYNTEYNCYRLREFDGSHQIFPGMNPAWRERLNDHQKNTAFRVVQTGDTGIFHCVGAGKTATMIAAGMEQKRLGFVKKPLYVVPNHMVKQFTNDFRDIYPGANILTPSKDDYKKANRRRLMSQIATGNWDAVIVPHSAFTLLRMSPEANANYIQSEIKQLETAVWEAKAAAGDRNNRIVKQLESMKRRREQKLTELVNNERKDDTLTFEETGIDFMFVDEAHNFKNLFFATKQNRIAGLSNSASQRAQDMFMKVLYLGESNPGRAVVLTTGTPISNTVAEMYTMQRYLQLSALDRSKIGTFDGWAQCFGETVTGVELAPDAQSFRLNTRFAKFTNVPELLQLFRMVADVKTEDDLKLPKPKLYGDKPEIIRAEPSQAFLTYQADILDRVDKIKSGRVEPHIDNMLKVTNDGRKAALDIRLVDPEAPDDPESKVNQAVANIYSIWAETHETKSTQLIFCDLSTPSKHRAALQSELTDALAQADQTGESADLSPDEILAAADTATISVYDDMKAKLIVQGIPEQQIAFIHDANTPEKKDALFKALNNGEIRICFGSTAKMGEGTNVQRLLFAEHHLDVPWKPSHLEQRDGRILRRGNTNSEVHIFRYVTERSFDAYMWQLVEGKAKFINQVMKGDLTTRTIEDVSMTALTAAEAKAAATGNPLIVEKAGIDAEIQRLQMVKRQHEQSQFSIHRKVNSELPSRIADTKAYLERAKADLAAAPNLEGDAFSIVLNGHTYNKRTGAAEYFEMQCERMYENRKTDVGKVGPFRLQGERSREYSVSGTTKNVYALRVIGQNTYDTSFSSSARGLITRLENIFTRLPEQIALYESHLHRDEKLLADYQKELGKPFDQQPRLDALLTRQAQLEAELMPAKDPAADTPPLPADPTAPEAIPDDMLVTAPAHKTWPETIHDLSQPSSDLSPDTPYDLTTVYPEPTEAAIAAGVFGPPDPTDPAPLKVPSVEEVVAISRDHVAELAQADHALARTQALDPGNTARIDQIEDTRTEILSSYGEVFGPQAAEALRDRAQTLAQTHAPLRVPKAVSIEDTDPIPKTPQTTADPAWRTEIDEGPAGWEAGKNDITRTDKGPIDPSLLLHIPGERGEHDLFASSPTGRMTPVEWRDFVADIKAHGVIDAPLITKERDGTTYIHEGNHRIRAAVAAGLETIPIEFRYFGNSQRTSLIYDPETKTISPEFRPKRKRAIHPQTPTENNLPFTLTTDPASWDFKDTFPKPLSGTREHLEFEAPDAIAGIHKEQARELRAYDAEMEALREAERTDTDPNTGNPGRTEASREKIREFVAQQMQIVPQKRADSLAAYADAFGFDAAARFDAFVKIDLTQTQIHGESPSPEAAPTTSPAALKIDQITILEARKALREGTLSIIDSYEDNPRAPRTMDTWIKSDISSEPTRFYVTLPDGMVLSPDELFRLHTSLDGTIKLTDREGILVSGGDRPPVRKQTFEDAIFNSSQFGGHDAPVTLTLPYGLSLTRTAAQWRKDWGQIKAQFPDGKPRFAVYAATQSDATILPLTPTQPSFDPEPRNHSPAEERPAADAAQQVQVMARDIKNQPKVSQNKFDHYKSRLVIPVEGNTETKFETQTGTQIATGYNRIVIGERGPYIEFDPEQIRFNQFHIPEDQIWRQNDGKAYYVEFRSDDAANVKLYYQKREVDYADYKVGKCYIDPMSLCTEHENILVHPLPKKAPVQAQASLLETTATLVQTPTNAAPTQQGSLLFFAAPAPSATPTSLATPPRPATDAEKIRARQKQFALDVTNLIVSLRSRAKPGRRTKVKVSTATLTSKYNISAEGHGILDMVVGGAILSSMGQDDMQIFKSVQVLVEKELSRRETSESSKNLQLHKQKRETIHPDSAATGLAPEQLHYGWGWKGKTIKTGEDKEIDARIEYAKTLLPGDLGIRIQEAIDKIQTRIRDLGGDTGSSSLNAWHISNMSKLLSEIDADLYSFATSSYNMAKNTKNQTEPTKAESRQARSLKSILDIATNVNEILADPENMPPVISGDPLQHHVHSNGKTLTHVQTIDDVTVGLRHAAQGPSYWEAWVEKRFCDAIGRSAEEAVEKVKENLVAAMLENDKIKNENWTEKQLETMPHWKIRVIARTRGIEKHETGRLAKLRFAILERQKQDMENSRKNEFQSTGSYLQGSVRLRDLTESVSQDFAVTIKVAAESVHELRPEHLSSVMGEAKAQGFNLELFSDWIELNTLSETLANQLRAEHRKHGNFRTNAELREEGRKVAHVVRRSNGGRYLAYEAFSDTGELIASQNYLSKGKTINQKITDKGYYPGNNNTYSDVDFNWNFSLVHFESDPAKYYASFGDPALSSGNTTPLSQFTPSQYNRLVYDAAISRLNAGQSIYYNTQTKQFRHDNPTTIRFNDQKGRIETYHGKTEGWLHLIYQPLDSLAHNLGLPTSYDHSQAVFDATPDSGQPFITEKPLTPEQIEFGIAVALGVAESDALTALTPDTLKNYLANERAQNPAYVDEVEAYIKTNRPDLFTHGPTPETLTQGTPVEVNFGSETTPKWRKGLFIGEDLARPGENAFLVDLQQSGMGLESISGQYMRTIEPQTTLSEQTAPIAPSSEVVSVYKTRFGTAALTIRSDTDKDGKVTYRYNGKYGAGSRLSYEDMLQTVTTTKESHPAMVLASGKEFESLAPKQEQASFINISPAQYAQILYEKSMEHAKERKPYAFFCNSDEKWTSLYTENTRFNSISGTIEYSDSKGNWLPLPKLALELLHRAMEVPSYDHKSRLTAYINEHFPQFIPEPISTHALQYTFSDLTRRGPLAEKFKEWGFTAVRPAEATRLLEIVGPRLLNETEANYFGRLATAQREPRIGVLDPVSQTNPKPEPWTLPLAQFHAAVARGEYDFSHPSFKKPVQFLLKAQATDKARALTETYHRAQVTLAFAQGQPVPTAVMADYPDLAQAQIKPLSPLDAFEAAGGEPHQVTRAGWTDLMRGHRRFLGQPEQDGTPASPYAAYEAFHREAVEKALQTASKDTPYPVAAHIMRDYPDLALKYLAPDRWNETQIKARVFGAAFGIDTTTPDGKAKSLEQLVAEINGVLHSKNQAPTITHPTEQAPAPSPETVKTKQDLQPGDTFTSVFNNKEIVKVLEAPQRGYVRGEIIKSHNGFGGAQRIGKRDSYRLDQITILSQAHNSTTPSPTNTPLTIPAPDFKTGALWPTLSKRVLDHDVWHSQSDKNSLLMEGTIRAFGRDPSPYAKQKAEQYRAAREAGYNYNRYNISGLKYMYVLEKDGHLLTNAGAAQLLGKTITPETGPAPQTPSETQPGDTILVRIKTGPDTSRWQTMRLLEAQTSSNGERLFQVEGDNPARPGIPTSWRVPATDIKPYPYSPESEAAFQTALRVYADTPATLRSIDLDRAFDTAMEANLSQPAFAAWLDLQPLQPTTREALAQYAHDNSIEIAYSKNTEGNYERTTPYQEADLGRVASPTHGIPDPAGTTGSRDEQVPGEVRSRDHRPDPAEPGDQSPSGVRLAAGDAPRPQPSSDAPSPSASPPAPTPHVRDIATLTPGEKYTLFRFNDFGMPGALQFELKKVEVAPYAQYKDAVTLTYRAPRQRYDRKTMLTPGTEFIVWPGHVTPDTEMFRNQMPDGGSSSLLSFDQQYMQIARDSVPVAPLLDSNPTEIQSHSETIKLEPRPLVTPEEVRSENLRRYLESHSGFAETLDEQNRMNVLELLQKNCGGITAKERIDKAVKDGYSIGFLNGERILEKGGGYLDTKYLGKVGLDYAEFLISQRKQLAPPYFSAPMSDAQAITLWRCQASAQQSDQPLPTFGKKGDTILVATQKPNHDMVLHIVDPSGNAVRLEGALYESSKAELQAGKYALISTDPKEYEPFLEYHIKRTQSELDAMQQDSREALAQNGSVNPDFLAQIQEKKTLLGTMQQIKVNHVPQAQSREQAKGAIDALFKNPQNTLAGKTKEEVVALVTRFQELRKLETKLRAIPAYRYEYGEDKAQEVYREFSQVRSSVIDLFGIKATNYDKTRAVKFLDAHQVAERTVTPEWAAARYDKLFGGPAQPDPKKSESTDTPLAPGSRVILENGRHGEILSVETYSMQAITGQALTQTTHGYAVRTDQGAIQTVTTATPETGPAPQATPDPILNGHPIEPEILYSSIDLNMRRERHALVKCESARKPETKTSWQREADKYKTERESCTAAFASWATTHPEIAQLALVGKTIPNLPTLHVGKQAGEGDAIKAEAIENSRIKNRHHGNVAGVYIGRGTPYGNPFVIGKDGDTRDKVIAKYETYAREKVKTDPAFVEALKALRGQDLVCSCAPARCHGEVLLALIKELGFEQTKPNEPSSPEPQKQAPATPVTSPLASLRLEHVSEKAFVLKGDFKETYPLKDYFGRAQGGLGGSYNRTHGGWIFPKTRQQEVTLALEEKGLLPAGALAHDKTQTPTPPTPTTPPPATPVAATPPPPAAPAPAPTPAQSKTTKTPPPAPSMRM